MKTKRLILGSKPSSLVDTLYMFLSVCLILFSVYRLVKEKVEPIKGLYKLTKWIEDHGLKRAAVTNAPRPNAELMISTLGLTDFFHCLVIGDECEHPKPAPDPYLKALQLLNVSKAHTFICEVFFNFPFSWKILFVRFTPTMITETTLLL